MARHEETVYTESLMGILGLGATGRRSFLRSLLFGAASVGLGPVVKAAAKRSPLIDELTGNFVLRGETRTIKVASQVFFRPSRLIIPSNIGKNFLIKNVRINGRPQFVGTGGVSADVFSEMTFGVKLQMETAAPGDEIEIEVENVSGRAQRFASAFVGDALDRGHEYVIGIHSDDPLYAAALHEVDAIAPGSPRAGARGGGEG